MYYRRVGELPPKRHLLHQEAGGGPLFEELLGQEGFSGPSSLLYHRNVPSALVDVRSWRVKDRATVPNHPLRPVHTRLHDLFPGGGGGLDPVRDRRLVLGNPDVRITYVVADQPSPLYSDAVGDEVVFVERGRATLETVLGRLDVGEGDIVVVPRAVIHRWVPHGEVRLYCVEASGHVAPPAKYLSRYGQFLEGAPLTERDLRVVEGPLLAAEDEAGVDTEVYVLHRSGDGIAGSVMVHDHHPFDVVGWDGQLHPYAFHHRSFSPVTGEVLQPPPTYQVLQGDAFVICTFVPRPLEFHPQALKVPYYHANSDSDEVMFYFMGETAARRGTGIGPGSLSLHPAGYTHGPTADAYLSSGSLTESKETAFMVDTFRALALGEGARAAEDPGYAWTWSGRGPVPGARSGGAE